MKASELMTSDHLWVSADDSTVFQVAKLMADHSVGCIPIVDANGKLEGVVTDRDVCCRIVAQGRPAETLVREIMSEPVHTVDAQADLSEVETIMMEYKIRRLPVVDEDRRLLGFVSIGDLAKHLHGLLKSHQVADTLEAVSTD